MAWSRLPELTRQPDSLGQSQLMPAVLVSILTEVPFILKSLDLDKKLYGYLTATYISFKSRYWKSQMKVLSPNEEQVDCNRLPVRQMKE